MPLPLKTFSTGGILYWVCGSVSESASQKSCEHHISKPIKAFIPIFGHRCIWVHRCAD